MARRPALIKIKAKAQKKTKSEQYIINLKGFGPERPYTSKELSGAELSWRYTWYNNMCDMKEAKSYLITYLKNVGRDEDVKKFRDVPDKWVHLTVCWIARIISEGGQISEQTRAFFNDRLDVMLSRDYSKKDAITEIADNEEAPAPKTAKPTLSIQDRMKVQAENLICELEEAVDKFITDWQPGFKMYDWLQGKEVSAVNAKRIHEFYNPQLLEIEEAYEGNEELLEGYKAYGKTNLKKLFGFYVMLVEDCELYMDNSKKVRKPRKTKPMTTEKKFKDFKHQEFDNIRKIQSVQPVRILGATELWTFSTKYNQLTVFRAKSGTLDVHRTAITNFDPAQSKTRKLKANTVQAVLNEVLNGGKVSLRNLMANTKGSDQKLQERMNENTLLLRVLS